jgi:hypothetical protein
VFHSAKWRGGISPYENLRRPEDDADNGRCRAFLYLRFLNVTRGQAGRVVILAEHRPATVPADQRPLPSVDKYDDLLGRETS